LSNPWVDQRPVELRKLIAKFPEARPSGRRLNVLLSMSKLANGKLPVTLWGLIRMMLKLALLAASALALASPSSAAISLGPTVNGVQTFTDSNTGRNWARLDTFFNVSYNFMVADLTDRGFTVATVDDLNPLFASINVAADFNGVAAITGRAPNRELIWGAYGPLASNGTVDWAFAFAGAGWTFGTQGTLPDAVPNAGTPDADMNLWAFTTGGGGAVPEPASWAMLIAGFGLVGAMARRRKAALA
jgi:hypothetical protein